METHEIIIRQATISDVGFIAKSIIEADKSGTEKLSFSTLFEITEQEAEKLIIKMLEEEIDGCELSVSSFLIAVYQTNKIGAFAGWVEAEGQPPSGILKSNLIAYYFGIERIKRLREKNEVLSSILIDKTPGTLQLEYMYVAPEARGYNVGMKIIDALIKRGLAGNSDLTIAEIQLLANNYKAKNLYERSGFLVRKSAKANNKDILLYLGGDEKILMTKTLK